MYKYLKKIIHNLWHNYLVNLVLTKNLSSHCTGTEAALRRHWWDCVLPSLPCFRAPPGFRAHRLLLSCPPGQRKQPVSQVRRRVPRVRAASHLQQEGSFGSDVPTLSSLTGPRPLTLMVCMIPFFEAASLYLWTGSLSHDGPAKNLLTVQPDDIGPWFLASQGDRGRSQPDGILGRRAFLETHVSRLSKLSEFGPIGLCFSFFCLPAGFFSVSQQTLFSALFSMI